MTYNYDPELVDVISMMPDFDLTQPNDARAIMRELSSSANATVDTSAVDIETREIDGENAEPSIAVRIYRQKKTATAQLIPGLLFIHGGAFVIGDLDTEHSACVAIATQLNVVIVSVDYRLAPEHTYPAAIDDCYSALVWMHHQAEELGIDAQRIGVYGQSAGGGLSAALALMSRDKKGPTLCFQYLNIPELDDRLTTSSMKTFTDTPLWNRPSAELSWTAYLGDSYPVGGDGTPCYAAPARAENLRGLPPTYLCAVEFDPLRDEDVLYALRLMQAGVSVELHVFPGTFHGSAMMAAHAEISQRQAHEMIAVLAKGLKVGI